jgi:hypothetical protein
MEIRKTRCIDFFCSGTENSDFCQPTFETIHLSSCGIPGHRAEGLAGSRECASMNDTSAVFGSTFFCVAGTECRGNTPVNDCSDRPYGPTNPSFSEGVRNYTPVIGRSKPQVSAASEIQGHGVDSVGSWGSG